MSVNNVTNGVGSGSKVAASKALSKRQGESVLDRDMMFPQIANGNSQLIVSNKLKRKIQMLKEKFEVDISEL